MRRKPRNSCRHGSHRGRRLRLELLEPRVVLDGQLAITELMAFNGTTLADQDGDFSDWIELHNTGPTPVNLAGYYLTDDADDLTRWQFPSTDLGAGGYLVVFASGKDRAVPGQELHTNFGLNNAGEFLALVNPDATTIESQYAPEFPNQVLDVSYGTFQADTTLNLLRQGDPASVLIPSDGDLGLDWTSPGFDDAHWTAGATPVGFGTLGAPEATPPGPRDPTYFAPFGPGGTYNIYQITSRTRTRPSTIRRRSGTGNWTGWGCGGRGRR